MHKRKYDVAALGALSVNSRVSRIYGEGEKRFAAWYRQGDLFKRLRNGSIYLALSDGTLTAPQERISKEEAHLVICMAGEVYAELQGVALGTGPENHARIIKEVDQFRESAGR